jgi:hypothetical protein
MGVTWECPVCGTTNPVEQEATACRQCGRMPTPPDDEQPSESAAVTHRGHWEAGVTTGRPDLRRVRRQDTPPQRSTASKWENLAGILNVGSLLLIPVAIWLDEFSAGLLLLGALTNGAAGIAWIISGVRGGRPGGCWAIVGVVLSGFLAMLFFTFAVWSGV